MLAPLVSHSLEVGYRTQLDSVLRALSNIVWYSCGIQVKLRNGFTIPSIMRPQDPHPTALAIAYLTITAHRFSTIFIPRGEPRSWKLRIVLNLDTVQSNQLNQSNQRSILH